MTCATIQPVQASALVEGAVSSALQFYARLPRSQWHHVRPVLHRQRIAFVAVNETNNVNQIVGVHVWLSARPLDFSARRLSEIELRDSMTTWLRFRREEEVEVSVKPGGRVSCVPTGGRATS